MFKVIIIYSCGIPEVYDYTIEKHESCKTSGLSFAIKEFTEEEYKILVEKLNKG